MELSGDNTLRELQNSISHLTGEQVINVSMGIQLCLLREIMGSFALFAAILFVNAQNRPQQ